MDTKVLKFIEVRDYSGARMIRSFLRRVGIGEPLRTRKTSHEKVGKVGILGNKS